MNICFFSGNIISDVEFQFIINDKDNISVCYFNLLLDNNSIIKVVAYNEIADFCYSNLKKNDFINIQGYLCNSNKKSKIILMYIENNMENKKRKKL